MSDWKNAYGWSGHIIASDDEGDPDPTHNLTTVPDAIFERLVEDREQGDLDERIKIKVLGIEDGPTYALACGSPASFSEGWPHYGTIFAEAERRAGGQPLATDYDSKYLAAMKEVYGLTLPPCHLMVGCSSEH